MFGGQLPCLMLLLYDSSMTLGEHRFCSAVLSRKFARNAHKNYSVICAGAGRAAHLAGMCASLTKIPVIGVPIKDKKTDGISALFSVAEMPNGIPVATTAINGALNAGLLAISIIALQDKKIKLKLQKYRIKQTKSVKKKPK